MNLQSARITLRPRTLAETFDLGLRWCSGVGGKLYLVLCAWVLLPAALACYGLRVLAEYEWALVWLIAVGLGMVLQGPFTIAASRLMFEPEVTARAVLRQFASRLGHYLVALVVTRVVIAGGLLTVFALPWTWGYCAFVHEAVLLEGQGAFAGVKRGGQFVAGQYGAVVALGMGLALAVCLFVVAADQAGGVLLEFTLQLGRPFGSLFDEGGSLTALIGFFAAVPYLASVRFLQYIDARTRRDAWDLQASFLALVVSQRERDSTEGVG